jgi:predicted metal-dependent hydrolase
MGNAETITVRRMAFEFPADLDPVFIPGEPEESYSNIALSLLLPYLEPYLIRTMRAARPHLTDPALIGALDKFAAQEGQHYRQHARFNAVFRDRGFDQLAPLEEELAADYEGFTKTKSLRFNLAFAEGFEAFTTAMALAATEVDASSWHPAARDLFFWHLLEELEHRTVAFDVYDQVCGGYLYRLFVGWFAQWHLVRFMNRATKCMLESDPATLSRYGGVAEHKARLRKLNSRFLRRFVPRLLPTYTPWYTPHDIAMPEGMKALAERYDRQASLTP